eukprot:CAMPEP_0182451274 /NCGR_PEP_ID=MMETSP1172-20130603/43631_1 /TAXON_ID=708627 /ORGANISM="Timspurckia oligopyrenoides, Strain CCMP3278" /LENGTH=317 /DNA_ID=CAMNT_0024649033 /DNA_START=1064 /DNA_END=2017 /DNA_ORIENTATION=-
MDRVGDNGAGVEEAVFVSPDCPLAWVFADEELECTPSRLNGLSAKHERWMMSQFVGHIEVLGEELNIPQLARAVAIKILQRFILLESLFDHSCLPSLPAAALFLACKLQECPRRLRQVVIVSYRLRIEADEVASKNARESGLVSTSASTTPYQSSLALLRSYSAAASATGGSRASGTAPEFTIPPQIFRHERDAVLQHEQSILRSIAFDLNIDHPYKYMVELVETYIDSSDPTKRRAVLQACWNFLNDSFRTMTHMKYDEREVASGAFLLATQFSDAGLRLYEGIPWWQHFRCDPKRISGAANMMLDAYDTKEANKS